MPFRFVLAHFQYLMPVPFDNCTEREPFVPAPPCPNPANDKNYKRFWTQLWPCDNTDTQRILEDQNEDSLMKPRNVSIVTLFLAEKFSERPPRSSSSVPTA